MAVLQRYWPALITTLYMILEWIEISNIKRINEQLLSKILDHKIMQMFQCIL